MSEEDAQQLELTALQSIYGDDFIEVAPPKAWKSAPRLHEFIILVYHPDPVHADKVHFRLHVKFPKTYPKLSCPIFAIEKPAKGLTDAQVATLQHEVNVEAQRLRGFEMVFNIITFCQDWIIKNVKAPVEVVGSLALQMNQRAIDEEKARRQLEIKQTAEAQDRLSRAAEEFDEQLKQETLSLQALLAHEERKRNERGVGGSYAINIGMRRRANSEATEVPEPGTSGSYGTERDWTDDETGSITFSGAGDPSLSMEGAIDDRLLRVETMVETYPSEIAIGDVTFHSVKLYHPRPVSVGLIYLAEPIVDNIASVPPLEHYVVTFEDPYYYTTTGGRKKLQKLQEELQKLSTLRHPKLLPVYAFKMIDPCPSGFQTGAGPAGPAQLMILTELAPALTLHDVLEDCESLREDRAVDYLTQILTGLQALHLSDIIHRGITPRAIGLVSSSSLPSNPHSSGYPSHGSGSSSHQKTVKVWKPSYPTRLMDMNRSNSFGPNTPSGGSDDSGRVPEGWICADVQNGSSLHYTRRRDIHAVGIVFLQMLMGLDVVERFPDPEIAIHASSISPLLAKTILFMVKPQPKDRVSCATILAELSDVPRSPTTGHRIPTYFNDPRTPMQNFYVGSPELAAGDYFRTSASTAALPAPPTPSSMAITYPPPLALSQPTPRPGVQTKTLSRWKEDWEELELLGRGGFGSVVKARNKIDGRIYAVKKIRLRTNQPVNDTKIWREVSALSRLSHRNVVRYYTTWVETAELSHSQFASDDSSISGSGDGEGLTSVPGMEVYAGHKRYGGLVGADVFGVSDDDGDRYTFDDESPSTSPMNVKRGGFPHRVNGRKNGRGGNGNGLGNGNGNARQHFEPLNGGFTVDIDDFDDFDDVSISRSSFPSIHFERSSSRSESSGDDRTEGSGSDGLGIGGGSSLGQQSEGTDEDGTEEDSDGEGLFAPQTPNRRESPPSSVPSSSLSSVGTKVAVPINIKSPRSSGSAEDNMGTGVSVDFGMGHMVGRARRGTLMSPQKAKGKEREREKRERKKEKLEREKEEKRQRILRKDDAKERKERKKDKKAKAQTPAVSRTLYIQMARSLLFAEFVERQTLRERIEEGLGESEAWRLFLQVVDALAHMSTLGILHRDIKLTNIFIDGKGDCKVGDFGLATSSLAAVDPSDVAPRAVIPEAEMTLEVGTRLYIAPEVQSRRRGPRDQSKADMYSLGIVFFEMNYKFSTGAERIAVLEDLRKAGIFFPPDWEQHRSRQRDIIKWLLQHEPEKRPTALELSQSALLPPRVEDEYFRGALRMMSKPDSPYRQTVLNSLFKQSVKSSRAFLYDNEAAEPPEYASLNPTVTQRLAAIFHLHGAVNIEPPLLLPVVDHRDEHAHATFLDRHGDMVMLPNSIFLPFARLSARERTERIKRYHITNVYRPNTIAGHPLLQKAALFDIVTPDLVSGPVAAGAEIMAVINEVLDSFPNLAQSYEIHVSHSKIVEIIMNRVPDELKSSVIDIVHQVKMSPAQRRSALQALQKKGLAKNNIEELEILSDINEDVDDVIGKLDKAAKTVAVFMQSAVNELKQTIQVARIIGVTRPVYFHGLMVRAHHGHFKNGILVEVVRKSKPSDVLAVGGRYDHVIRELPTPHKTPLNICAMGLEFGLDKITTAIASFINASFKTLVKEQHSFGFWSPRRCDVYVISYQNGHLQDRLEIVAYLWQHNISADLMYETGVSDAEQEHRYKREGILFTVYPRPRSGRNLPAFKVISILNGTEVDLSRQELVPWLQHQIADQKRIDATTSGAPNVSEGISTTSLSKEGSSTPNIHLLIPDPKKQRKSVKQIFTDKAFDRSLAIKNTFQSGMPVLAVDVSTGLFDAMVANPNWVSEDEAWKSISSMFAPQLSSYAQSIRDTALKRKAEGHRYILLFSVREDRAQLLTIS